MASKEIQCVLTVGLVLMMTFIKSPEIYRLEERVLMIIITLVQSRLLRP